MAGNPTPKLRPAIPATTKMPLDAFVQQFSVPGMSPEQTRGAALAIQSGQGGLPAGAGRGK